MTSSHAILLFLKVRICTKKRLILRHFERLKNILAKPSLLFANSSATFLVIFKHCEATSSSFVDDFKVSQSSCMYSLYTKLHIHTLVILCKVKFENGGHRKTFFQLHCAHFEPRQRS